MTLREILADRRLFAPADEGGEGAPAERSAVRRRGG